MAYAKDQAIEIETQTRKDQAIEIETRSFLASRVRVRVRVRVHM